MSLVDECIAAYGGLDRWRSAEAVEVRLAVRGLAFGMVGRYRLMRSTRAWVSTAGQRVEFLDWPESGKAGVLTSEEARIGASRRAVPRWGRRWDDLDALAFAGAALWTYVALPFVLADWGAEELQGRRLRFRVPQGIRSHCREQTLHLDERDLIVRHDYTAESLGRWARAAHRSTAFQTFEGLPVPTRRRVRLGPVGPVVVKVDVESARYV